MNDGGRRGRARGRARSALLVGLAVALAALLLVAFFISRHERGSEAVTKHPAAAPVLPSSTATASVAPREARLIAMMRRMTVAEKVGQLLMASFYGRSAADDAPSAVRGNLALTGLANAGAMVSRYHLGGVVYMGTTDNLRQPRQIAALSNGLQRIASGTHAGIPLLVATDQEGGAVSRIPSPFTQFPGNMALGADGRESDAYAAAQATGSELRALGVNMVLAPVADVSVDPANPVIGVRSFGGAPGPVAGLTRAAVSGYQSAGIAATAKHFPGHGDTHVDSHFALPVLRRTVAGLQRVDLPPFRAAIGAGVDAVMIGHLAVPSLDSSGRPASLSHSITTEWLRDRLGFRGVVITDSLVMGGVLGASQSGRLPLRAFQAGADILLMPPELDSSYHFLVRAVRGGRISKKRLDASVLRILRLKDRLGILADPLVDGREARESVGLQAHRVLAADIARRSITLVDSRPGTLPLRRSDRVLVAGTNVQAVSQLARELRRDGASVIMLATPAPVGEWLVAEATRQARTCDAAIVATDDVRGVPSQYALVEAILARIERTTVVSLGDPQDIAYLPGIRTYVAAYNGTAPSLRAIADALTGRAPMTGRLPVAIVAPGSSRVLFARGTGIQTAAVTP